MFASPLFIKKIMAIDYLAESERYRPKEITTLLVGEAPPPSGKTYFYVPHIMALDKPIEDDRSLPATIFNHYFKKRPKDKEEYRCLLQELQSLGVFLIDIYEKPLKVRNSPEGIKCIIEEIPKLHGKMTGRNIMVPDKAIVFLLARGNYCSDVKKDFPESLRIPWKAFRMS